jgi:hypothetical protein
LKYSIDTSAILDGWVRYYPPDVFPHVWEKLDRMIGRGELVATEVVLAELEKKHDEVYKWARERKDMFVAIDLRIQAAVKKILRRHKKLIDERKAGPGADPFVIALAQVEGYAVVTGEKPSGSPEKRPRIPDVCKALGIRYLNMLELFREQGWTF